MVTLSFQHSKSKRYKEAVALLSHFKGATIASSEITVEFTYTDIFERWEAFNLLFWITVDWKGTWLMWDKYKFYSHHDKVRVFYGIQTCHSKFMWHINHIMKVFPLIMYIDENKINTKALSENADDLIDIYNYIRKYISDDEIKRYIEQGKKDSI